MLEKEENKIDAAKDLLKVTIQPMNEIGEREVKTPEIQKILEKLTVINNDLGKSGSAVGDLQRDVVELEGDVNELLEGDKDRKIGEADAKLAALDATIDDLNLKRADALKKLIEYKDLIEAAKVDPGKSDPDVLAKLKKLEAEASLIAKEIKDIDEKAADLKKKRNDSKRLLDEIKAKP